MNKIQIKGKRNVYQYSKRCFVGKGEIDMLLDVPEGSANLTDISWSRFLLIHKEDLRNNWNRPMTVKSDPLNY